MFPEKNILSALTGKQFINTKYETIKDYNINLNDVRKSILLKEKEFIECYNIFDVEKVLSKCLRQFNIKVSSNLSESSDDPYWVEGEYDVMTERMSIIFCASEKFGTKVSIDKNSVDVLAFYIPCIIAHECGHIIQHYKTRFDDVLWSKTPQFRFGEDVYDMDYLLEDIEMEAFSIQMIMEYKAVGVLPTYRRYLSLFRSIRQKAKTKSDILTLNRMIRKMNSYTDKYSKMLGYDKIGRIKFRVR